jgi:hypothetical protein
MRAIGFSEGEKKKDDVIGDYCVRIMSKFTRVFLLEVMTSSLLQQSYLFSGFLSEIAIV